MTDKQPEALRLAEFIENDIPPFSEWVLVAVASKLRTQHAEIERLNAAIQWEQNRAERIGTHGPGCEKWGSAHYECLLRSVERKDALLRKCLKHVASNITRDGCEAEELFDAINSELSQ